MKTKLALLGATGQLGSAIARLAARDDRMEAREYSHADFDVITDACYAALPPFDVLVNCTAFHNVAKCESDPETAIAVNAYAVRWMAQECAARRAFFVTISTDYVFGGDGSRRHAYVPWDKPEPVNAYGVSKAFGETLARMELPPERVAIVRTASLFGHGGASGKGRGNFVETMLRLARENEPIRVVSDIFMSPTYVEDLAEKVLWIAGIQSFGFHHVVNEGDATWFGFAEEILHTVGKEPIPCLSEDRPEPFHRPAYSALVQSGGLQLRPWRDALKSYLKNR